MLLQKRGTWEVELPPAKPAPRIALFTLFSLMMVSNRSLLSIYV